MQFITHGQWWSIFRRHLPHFRQCLHRRTFGNEQISQYPWKGNLNESSCKFSVFSPATIDKYVVGGYPGSVRAVWIYDQSESANRGIPTQRSTMPRATLFRLIIKLITKIKISPHLHTAKVYQKNINNSTTDQYGQQKRSNIFQMLSHFKIQGKSAAVCKHCISKIDKATLRCLRPSHPPRHIDLYTSTMRGSPAWKG